MATTVQTSVTDNQATAPFFYLRITGLPFYVFATINPSASGYGSFAWSAPTGYPATWAQRGLQLPDDTIEQKFADIIGGVASPARCRLSVMDFADPAHPGFGYFSRLFAAGRALSDTSIPSGWLRNVVSAVPGADTLILVNGKSATWTANTDIYIGAETVGISTIDAHDATAGTWDLTIAARNKYVCFGNSGDGGTYYPPAPYHRTGFTQSGAVDISQAPLVTGDVVDVLGRTAALWMGHMRPDGNPEPETSSACLLLGRVTGLEIGKVGGMFDITLDSITADLTKGCIAPDLAHATIQPGFYLTSAAWRTFYLFDPGHSLETVTIPSAVYADAQHVVDAINTAIVTSTGVTVALTDDGNGGQVVVFASTATSTSVTSDFIVSTIPISNVLAAGGAQPGPASLLYALGFDPTVSDMRVSPGTTVGSTAIQMPRSIASTFVPTGSSTAISNALTLVEPFVAAFFFNNQGDGQGRAWARFGDGSLVVVRSSTGSTTNTVTTGMSANSGFTAALTGTDATTAGLGKFYYVDQGQTATIDQIVMFNTYNPGTLSYTNYLGALLASTTGATTDGVLNMYPEGVGLGWFKLLTAADWLIADETNVPRLAYVDASTKWIDLFTTYAREHGLFVVWDPSAGSIRLRRFAIPTKAAATLPGAAAANVSFTDSNRAQTSDRTSQRADRSSLRTSWKIQAAFSFNGDNKPNALVITDVRARSMYPNDARQESIDDKTLIDFPTLGATIANLISLYGVPWTVCQRSMNKRGMLLAPGTIHQIVDNTMVNPFTGASGITTGAAIYGYLTRVAMNPSDGAVTIEFVVNSSDDQSLYRQWSPSGLIDFDATTNGYVAATKTLTMKAHFSGSTNDALAFEAGDLVSIRSRDNSDPAALLADIAATIASVGATTIVLTADITAVSSVVESVVVLQKYNSATAARQSGASEVSWQGNGDTKIIQTTTTARLNKWS
jgi:hypothetical protein